MKPIRNSAGFISFCSVFLFYGIISGFCPDSRASHPDSKTELSGISAQGRTDSVDVEKIKGVSDLIAIQSEPKTDLPDELNFIDARHLPLPVRKFYLQTIAKSSSHPLVIFFTLLIFIFILNILFVFLILYSTNRYKNNKDRYIDIYRNLYESVLQSYLFGETEWSATQIKLKRIGKKLNRRILTDVLFNYQENLRGEMDTRITEIFFRLNLHLDAVKLAKSPFYYQKIRGLRELTNLYPDRAKPIVNKEINDTNDLVRGEAQISYIMLNPDKPFEFFRTLNQPFTRWTQLFAFHLFRLHQLPIPPFDEYLDSKHPNVRNFSLRMIIFFQQFENARAIFNMLESEMEMTRNLAIKAINDLRLFDGKQLIKEKYPQESKKNRLEIIRALRNIGDSIDFDFLEAILVSGSISEKTEACRTIYFMNVNSREQLLQFNRNMNNEFDQYINHVTEPRN